MDIGKPQRIIQVEPLTVPAEPVKEPAQPAPEREPAKGDDQA